MDLSGRGSLYLTGSDRIGYLHRVTAQAFEHLVPPSGVRASLLERTGKLVELVTAHAFSDHILMLTSTANRQRAHDWLGKFVFRDDVQVEDRTETTGQLWVRRAPRPA